jgi:hypothetical protein
MGNFQTSTQDTTPPSPQESPQDITRRPTHATTVKHELCSLCLTRYQREQNSECTCSHCSLPFCVNCMQEHVNALPQNVTQLSRQLRELEELFQRKKNMVQEEISKSTEEVKQCIKTYHNNLTDAHGEIRDGFANAKQDAEVIRSLIRSFH